VIFQEYVDAPKVIEFAKELTHSVGTVTEELTPPNTYQPGNIYVVLSGTESIDNGFQLVKCKSVSDSSQPPNHYERKLFGAGILKVTFKHLPKPLRSHIRYGNLGQFLLVLLGAEHRVLRAQTRERGPPSVLAEI
jgi:hypothetical protein